MLTSKDKLPKDSAKDASVELIREAFLYQSRFAGKTMVFKIEAPVIESAGFPYLMKDIALLAKTGINVVIVPGAAKYIDAALQEHGFSTPFTEGERVTAEDVMPYVEMAAFHAATRCITALSASRVDALIGNFVRARGRGVVAGCDLENTGFVDKIFTNAITQILNAGMIPVLPCIGWSPSGRAYNVSSDSIAIAVCAALNAVTINAVKLIIVSSGCRLYTNTEGYPSGLAEKSEDGRILRLSPQEARLILSVESERQKKAPLTDDKIVNALTLALGALDAHIERVHIIDSDEEGALLRELFSNLEAGTMIYADEYEAIRSVRAADIPDMLRIMEPLMQKGILLRRTAEDIQQKKEDFVVFVIDGAVHACAALHDWGEAQAEIAALAVDPVYAHMGAGKRLVYYLIDKAAKQGFKRVFALTTSTLDWFESLGFTEVPVESLPALKRQRYDRSRNSKVIARAIAPA